MAIMNCGRHVYDSDQYSECPYCASGRKVMDFKTVGLGNGVGKVRDSRSAAVIPNSKSQADLNDKYRTVPVSSTVSVNNNNAAGNSKPPVTDSGEAVPSVSPAADKGKDSGNPDVTDSAATFKDERVNIPAQTQKEENKDVTPYTPTDPVSVVSGQGYLESDRKPDDPSDYSMSVPVDGVNVVGNKSDSCEKSDVDAASVDDNKYSVRNRGGFGFNENKTVGVFYKTMKREPVVGWLVCVGGDLKGRDFRILAGMNTIGRSERMDICLHSDLTISKENHARVAYDPKHNGCRLIPSEKSTNIYINDEPVYTPVKLSNMDSVEMGESKFVFVSFCDDIYSWDKE